MRFEFIVLLAVLGSGLVAVSLADTKGDGDVEVPKIGVQPSFRAKFVMPKLFDFQAFRERFNKHYPNAAELVRRGKIYMARAFASFISAIKYKCWEATKYLKINPRSDWTIQEIDATENPIMDLFSNPTQSEADESNPTPAVEPEDVERVLADIVEHKDENPEYAAIAAELQGAQTRRRRSIDGQPKDKKQRHLSMDELMGAGQEEPQVVPSKYKTHVPSNNPNHEPLQVFSEGDNDDEQVKPIADDEAKRIDFLENGRGLLISLLGTLKGSTDALFGKIPDESSEFSLGPPPDEVYLDYRTTGCFLQPKEQGSCGSCYIFATTAVMEYQYCMQTANLVSFSEQYAVDCGLAQKLKMVSGCHGGVSPFVSTFYARFGLELAADYPYRAKEQACPYSSAADPKRMGHIRFEEPENWHVTDKKLLNQKNIARLLNHHGPMVIAIRTNPDFSQYGGGVDTTPCDPAKKTSHEMVLIGHGIEDGLEYWLIRNSHGIKFGLQGYYKLAKSYDMRCFVNVSYTKGQFSQNQVHDGKAVFDEIKKKMLLAHFGIKE